MRSYILFIPVLLIYFSCRTINEEGVSLFNFNDYKKISSPKSKKDSTIVFINLLNNGQYEKAEKIYPKLSKIDVSSGMIRVEGKEPFLNGLGDYMYDYDKNTYDFLALSVYLKSKYNTRLEFYDKMIRGSLRLDSTNVPAIFLLAKLRYENKIMPDALYLANKMVELEPNNNKLREIRDNLQSRQAPLGENLPTFSEFLKTDIYYIESE